MKYLLEIIVFVCGAAVMVLELVGSRVLAPYLGTSIFVWTSLIGIILGSLSLGYWWGGKIADKKPDYKTFSFIIFSAAIFIGAAAFLKEEFLNFLTNYISGIRSGSVIASLFLFAPANILLGMVSPYAVRLKIKDLEKSGKTVGNLYAVSTIGSIVGTFFTGFFLISFLGNTKILFLISIILILTSFFASFKFFLKIKLPMIIFLILGIGGMFLSGEIKKQPGVVDVDTQYQRVQIVDVSDPLTKEPVRYLKTDPYGLQSAMFLDDHDLVLRYQKFYRLSRHFRPDLKYSLMIGGGAFSYPKDYLKMFPEAKIDVVEIDPELTLLARRYFNLKDDPRMQIYSEDGRTFLNKTKNKYDAILIDAFKSYFVPYQLTTKETVKKIYDSLDEKGIVLLNIISSVNGEKGKFLRAEYATYKKFFPQVYLFLVRNKEEGDWVQNIMLVALKSEEKPVFENNDAELQEYLSRLWTKEIKNDTPILTDDFAPVDNYLAKIQKNL